MPLANRIIYKYRDDLYKIVTIMDNRPSEDLRSTCRSADEKTLDNIRRAARMIEAYGLCNEWDYFVTLTLDPQKYDRMDIDSFRKDFMQMLRDVRKKSGCKVNALLVPELHHNEKGWHMHALMSGLPLSELRPFTLHERLSGYLIRKIKDGATIYDWPRYRDRFGFCDVEPIGNRDAATRYIKKYITKGLDATAKHLEIGKHLYFVTRGLTLPMEMERASNVHPLDALPSWLGPLSPESSYTWDYGAADWYKLTPQQVEYIKDHFEKSSFEDNGSGREYDFGGDFDGPCAAL